MIRELTHSRGLQVAAGALVLSLVLGGWAFGRAVSIEPVGEAAPPVFATSAATAKQPARPPLDINAVVSNNVFAPERTPPPRRYRLGGAAPEAPKEAPPPQPTVLGTSVESATNSFAICRLESGPATIVRIGDKVGVFTVVSIERNVVVFTSPAGERVAIKAAST